MSNPILDEAFLESDLTIGKLKLRPFTIGSMTACRKLGLSIFMGEANDVSIEELQRQMVAFAWVQGAPLGDVLRALRDGKAQELIDAFEWGLTPNDIELLQAEISRISKLAEAAAVDVVQRNTPPDPDEPGN
jgi:hypothetical protein